MRGPIELLKKALLILVAALVVIGVAVVGGLHYASRTVEDFALIKAFGFSFEGLVRALYLIVRGFGSSFGAVLS